MKHLLMELPYQKNALVEFLSPETIEVHYGKHHRGYVDTLNRLIVGTPYEESTLKDTVLRSSGAIFNQAAQVWNHNFYWRSLSPQSEVPAGPFLRAIEKSFQTVDRLKREIIQAAGSVFGSGWVWLVLGTRGDLEVHTTLNADNPIRHSIVPLLGIDVWEHAYYLDYMNERTKYLESIEKILNWSFADKQYLEELNRRKYVSHQKQHP